MNKRSYIEAGCFFKQLREAAGYSSRSMFVDALRPVCGPIYDYNSLTRLEGGYTEPKLVHFLIYQRITNCDPAVIVNIPGLLAPAI